MAIYYGRFGTNYRSHVQGSCMGTIVRPETSVIHYHYSLRNNLEVRSSHKLRGGSLKSSMVLLVFGAEI